MIRYIQNPALRHYSAIFRHIQNLVQRLHTQKPDILGILKHSESFHNCNPVTYSELCYINENLWIFSTLTNLKPDTYFEPSQSFKIEFFSKIVKNYNYFSKVLHFRSLTRFWIYLSLNKYPLICRVTSRCVLYDTYSQPCLLSKFRHSVIFTSY